jgi:hypothetical protein
MPSWTAYSAAFVWGNRGNSRTGVIFLTEIVLDTKTLPEPLFRLIQTEKVKVRQADGEILLTPVEETDLECPLLGMFSDGKISVDKFIADKKTEKRLKP